jgi:hypothetical protein
MRKFIKRGLAALLVAGALLAAWIVFDLYRPLKVHIRNFDADEVARLDTAMWRSYYSRERLKMYRQLTELLETQYKLSFWRSQLVAFYAAKAAFVFKDGKTREDYEKALPDLEKFYRQIHDISTIDFDVDRAARLELKWWIVHRQRQQHAPGDLSRALADGAAVIYGVPAESLREYGDVRAQAMDI